MSKRFKGDRVIYLNEDNIGKKTKDEVLEAIEKLRDCEFLCAYGTDTARPFHLCFNDPAVFQQFKKTCKELGIKLISKIYTEEDIERVEIADQKANQVIQPEPNSTYHDPDGNLKVGE